MYIIYLSIYSHLTFCIYTCTYVYAMTLMYLKHLNSLTHWHHQKPYHCNMLCSCSCNSKSAWNVSLTNSFQFRFD